MPMLFRTLVASLAMPWLLACAATVASPAQEPAEAGHHVGAAVGSAALVEIDGRLTLDGKVYSGIVFDRHPGGAKKARYSLVDGRVEGAWTEWHPGGGIRFYGEWRAGLGEGALVYFHPNGEIRERATARADIWDGVAEGWHQNGAKAFERVYDQGRLVSERRFSETGELYP